MNRELSGQINKLVEEARLLHEEGQTYKAIDFLESSPIGQESSRLHAQIAHFRYLTQQYDSARLSAQKALQLDPVNKLGLFTMGELAMKARNFPEALAFFNETIARDTKSPHPYLRIADINNLQFDYDKSTDILKQGLEKHPGHEGLLEKLHYSLTMAGRIDEAKQIRNTRVKNRDPDAPDLQGLLNRFDALSPAKAIQQMKILLSMKHYKNQTLIYDRIASLCFQENQYSEAVDYLETLVALQPRNDRAKLRLAEAQVKAGNADEADRLLSQIETYRKDLPVRLIRAEIMHARGNHQDAMNLCVALLREYPRNKRLREFLKTLRKTGTRPRQDSA